MSYVTGTTHYNLPQTVGTDKRDWADTNQAFADIDAAIYGAVEDVATAASDISGIKDRLDTAEGNITQLESDVSGIDGRLTTAEQTIVSQGNKIDDVKSDTQDMICAYSEPTATSTHDYAVGDYFRYNDVLYRATQVISIGDTIVPDTNCTTTNVSSELLDLKSDIPSTDNLVTKNVINSYTEQSMIATRNYRAGEYILINNNIYKAITAITSGDTLTVNSNVKATTIGDELFENGHHLIASITPTATTTNAQMIEAIDNALGGYTEEMLSHVYIKWKGLLFSYGGVSTSNQNHHRFEAYRIDSAASPAGLYAFEFWLENHTLYNIPASTTTTSNLSNDIFDAGGTFGDLIIYT